MPDGLVANHQHSSISPLGMSQYLTVEPDWDVGDSSGHLQGSVSLVQGDCWWGRVGWSHCVCVSLISALELIVSKVSKVLQLPDY